MTKDPTRGRLPKHLKTLAEGGTVAQTERAHRAPYRSNLLPPTRLHPYVPAMQLATVVWFMAVAWLTFLNGYAGLALAFATILALMFFTIFVAGAANAEDVTPDRAKSRSFRDFLEGTVDIRTGPINGREVMLQMVALPVALAAAFTFFGIVNMMQ